MRRAQNANTHALKQPRLFQNISPVCSSFVLVIATDMHLESESEKRAKNVDLRTAKNVHIQPTLFRFLKKKRFTNSYKLTSDLFTVVWPVVAFSSLQEFWGKRSAKHFPVEVSSSAVMPLFTPGSVHSGSASWHDCGRMFPYELRVSSFPL